jgi:hypothetical protein
VSYGPDSGGDEPSRWGTDTFAVKMATDKDPADPYAGAPYEGSPEGWWTRYGGALDVRSGVVFIPQGADLPPCPFPRARCRARGKQ